MYDSSFKNRHFVRSRARDSLEHNNTLNKLKIILYYSYSLTTCECLIYQIYQ